MVNVAIVGAGVIAKKHSEALSTVPSAKILAVVDVIEERAKALAEAHGARAYTRLGDCLSDVDLVYVLTPPSTHRDLALEAMAAGKHVVCEKPIAASMADAEVMVAAAEQYGTKLMVAFNMRYRRGFRMLRETAEAGTLGSIVSFWSQRLGIGVRQGYNWRTDPDLLCGMTVESLSHDIDMVRWIAGEIISVRATVFESRPDLPGFDDNASVILSLASGATAVIHASWSSHLERNSRGIVGTKGTAIVEGPGLWDLRELRVKTDGMPYETVSIINDAFDVSSYAAEDKAFVTCVENMLDPPVTGIDGLKALRVSQAILCSHLESRTVVLD